MVGFEVTPLSPSSSIRRLRPPPSTSSRWRLSSQIAWPSASISRSLLLMLLPFSAWVISNRPANHPPRGARPPSVPAALTRGWRSRRAAGWRLSALQPGSDQHAGPPHPGGRDRRIARLDQRRRAERARDALRVGVAVEGGALTGHTSDLADCCLDRLRWHLLAVACAGGARDRLVHQRPAEVVGARAQRQLAGANAELRPGGLDVGKVRVQRQARDRMHQDRF